MRAQISEWIDTFGVDLIRVAESFAEGPDEAADIVQETWIRAVRHGDRLQGEADVGAWLYRVTLNIGRSRYRRRKRRNQLMALWAPPPPATFTPISIQQELEHHALWRIVATLPRLQQSVVLLRVRQDLSISQIAEQLGVSEGSVRKSMNRALLKLRGAVPNLGRFADRSRVDPRRATS